MQQERFMEKNDKVKMANENWHQFPNNKNGQILEELNQIEEI